MTTNLEQNLLAGVEAILGPNGLLADYGLRHQREQHQYARNVAIGLARGTDDMASMTLLEAATGTGKTVGYGVPLALFAALTEQRVAISTFTLHLQRQILAKDMPLILEMVQSHTGKTLSVARRIGLRNFISLSRLAEAANDIPDNAGDSEEWASMLEFIQFAQSSLLKESAATGEIAQFLEERGLQSLPFDLSADQVCLTADCPDAERAAFELHCAEARNADVLITSHAMTIMHTRSVFKLLDDERQIAAMVMDEADQFVSAAENILGQRFPVSRVRSMLEKFEAPEFQKCALAAKKLEASLKGMREEHGGAQIMVATEKHSKLNDSIGVFAKELSALLKAVNSASNKEKKAGQKPIDGLSRIAKEQLAEISGYSLRLQELAKQFKGGEPNKTMVAAVSFSPCKNYPTLSVVPTNPGYFLSKLWLPRKDEEGVESLYLKACVMTSATLGDPGQANIKSRFSKFMYECGIFDHARINPGSKERRQILQLNDDLFESFAPMVYGRMEFILADPALPKPLLKDSDDSDPDAVDDYTMSNSTLNPIWQSYVANAICYANRELKGRTLVLVNSYRDAEVFAQMLSSLPDNERPQHIYVHKRGMKLGEIVEGFKREPDSILISPSAWEGLNISWHDLPGGNRVNNLVITRLPYGGVDGVKTKVWVEAMMRGGMRQDEAMGVMFFAYRSAARRKMTQGLGRGIRSFSDHCRVLITDPRFPLMDSLASKMELGASQTKTDRSFHHCVPGRFQMALTKAKVLRIDGTVFSPFG